MIICYRQIFRCIRTRVVWCIIYYVYYCHSSVILYKVRRSHCHIFTTLIYFNWILLIYSFYDLIILDNHDFVNHSFLNNHNFWNVILYIYILKLLHFTFYNYLNEHWEILYILLHSNVFTYSIILHMFHCCLIFFSKLSQIFESI